MIPVLGLLFVLYTIYSNIVGVASPYVYFPYIIFVWLSIGFILAMRRGVAERMRTRLAADDSTEPTAQGEKK